MMFPNLPPAMMQAEFHNRHADMIESARRGPVEVREVVRIVPPGEVAEVVMEIFAVLKEQRAKIDEMFTAPSWSGVPILVFDELTEIDIRPGAVNRV